MMPYCPGSHDPIASALSAEKTSEILLTTILLSNDDLGAQEGQLQQYRVIFASHTAKV